MPTSAYGASLLSSAWHSLKAAACTDIYFKGDIPFFTYDTETNRIVQDPSRPITDTRAAKIIAEPDGKFSVVICHHQKFINRDRLTYSHEAVLQEFKKETRNAADIILRSIELSWRNQHFSKQSPS